MEYVILTGAFSVVLLGMSNWLFNPSGQMFNNRGAIAGQSFGVFGDAWVELTRSIMHGIGSPSPFADVGGTAASSASITSGSIFAGTFGAPFGANNFLGQPFAANFAGPFGAFATVTGPVSGDVDTAYPLGSLSEQYESGGRGPGTVANNPGDPGGASYGTYQLASNTGTLGAFINSSDGQPYASELSGLQPGTAAFDQAWAGIANRDPSGFEQAQHSFIQATHYDPAVDHLRNTMGFDVSSRSRAVQNAVWSTAVQHGSDVRPITNQFRGEDMNALSDDEIISRIYGERGRTSASGNLVYFSSSSSEIQQGVANRFQQERADALEALEGEREILSRSSSSD